MRSKILQDPGSWIPEIKDFGSFWDLGTCLLARTDIQAAHRLQSKDTITCKFYNREVRDNILSERFELMKQNDRSRNSPFINESLTKHNRALFNELLTAKRNGKLTRCSLVLVSFIARCRVTARLLEWIARTKSRTVCITHASTLRKRRRLRGEPISDRKLIFLVSVGCLEYG